MSAGSCTGQQMPPHSHKPMWDKVFDRNYGRDEETRFRVCSCCGKLVYDTSGGVEHHHPNEVRISSSLTELMECCLDNEYYALDYFFRTWVNYKTAKPRKAFIMLLQKLSSLFLNFSCNMDELLSKKLQSFEIRKSTKIYKTVLVSKLK